MASKVKDRAKGKVDIDKKGNVKVAGLKEIRPGVLVNDNYKPGKDPALDAVIKKDPTKIKSSGLSDRWKV